MTICTKCKNKIKGRTAYWKSKAVCKNCFYDLKEKPIRKYKNIAEIRKEYLEWIKTPVIKRERKKKLLQKSLGVENE